MGGRAGCFTFAAVADLGRRSAPQVRRRQADRDGRRARPRRTQHPAAQAHPRPQAVPASRGYPRGARAESESAIRLEPLRGQVVGALLQVGAAARGRQHGLLTARRPALLQAALARAGFTTRGLFLHRRTSVMWRRVRFCRGGLGIVAAIVAALAASAGSAMDGASAGAWREKVRLVWDETTHASARRPVRVFDPHPELDLDFQWEPYAGAGTDARGTVYGPGRLTWRQRGSAAWDGAAITS